MLIGSGSFSPLSLLLRRETFGRLIVSEWSIIESAASGPFMYSCLVLLSLEKRLRRWCPDLTSIIGIRVSLCTDAGTELAIMAPVVLVLGSGPGIGANIVARFLAKSFRTASAVRSKKDRVVDERQLELYADLVQPISVSQLFNRVKNELGEAPTVVIYNGELMRYWYSLSYSNK